MQKSFLISLSMFAVLLVSIGDPDSCKYCRPVEQPVWYEPGSHHLVRSEDSQILRVDVDGDQISMTIRTPSGPASVYGGSSNYQVLTSKDIGRTWFPASIPIGSPLAIKYNYFVQAPSDPRVLYRFVEESGIYQRSYDSGNTWITPQYRIAGKTRREFVEQLRSSPSCLVQFDLAAVHPRNPLRLFAYLTVATNPGTATRASCRGELDEIYDSADGGDTWHLFAKGMRNPTPMGISPSNPQVIYAHSWRGVVRSADSGRSWTPVGQARKLELRPLTFADKDPKTQLLKGRYGMEIYQFVVDPHDPDLVYIVANKGILRTLDGGRTWCLLSIGFDEVRGVHSLALNPSNPDEMFVGTTRGVYRSLDRGCKFLRLYPPGG